MLAVVKKKKKLNTNKVGELGKKLKKKFKKHVKHHLNWRFYKKIKNKKGIATCIGDLYQRGKKKVY